MTTTEAPLFGVSTKPVEDTAAFRLMSYGPRDRDTGGARETVHQFTARTEVDAGTALGALNGGEGAQAGVFVRYLRRALLDDDGIPSDARPRPVTDDPDTPDDEAGAELALTGDAAPTAEMEEALHTGEWEIDGQRFPSRSLAAQHAHENGSSLRRFGALMDDPEERVQLTALQDIIKYLTKEGGGRPTGRSQPSRKPATRKKGR